ncbi:hypothetical protein N8H11_21630, partial [Mycobacterium tuberculosis]|nr:hypothetical protein [Mycobacterium tuberculosis]
MDVINVVEFDALTDEQKLEAEQMVSTFYNNQRDKHQLQLFGAPPSPVVRRGALPSTLASMQPQHQPMQQMDPYTPMA